MSSVKYLFILTLLPCETKMRHMELYNILAKHAWTCNSQQKQPSTVCCGGWRAVKWNIQTRLLPPTHTHNQILYCVLLHVKIINWSEETAIKLQNKVTCKLLISNWTSTKHLPNEKQFSDHSFAIVTKHCRSVELQSFFNTLKQCTCGNSASDTQWTTRWCHLFFAFPKPKKQEFFE